MDSERADVGECVTWDWGGGAFIRLLKLSRVFIALSTHFAWWNTKFQYRPCAYEHQPTFVNLAVPSRRLESFLCRNPSHHDNILLPQKDLSMSNDSTPDRLPSWHPTSLSNPAHSSQFECRGEASAFYGPLHSSERGKFIKIFIAMLLFHKSQDAFLSPSHTIKWKLLWHQKFEALPDCFWCPRLPNIAK